MLPLHIGTPHCYLLINFFEFVMPNDTVSIGLLKKKRLRLTDCRQEVIEFFLNNRYAISQPELEKALHSFDRVTLYRTLNTFLEKGIIHKVPDNSGITRYALCSGGCSEHHHQDEHVHFKCTNCQHIQCIATIAVPQVPLPEGFVALESQFLINGICKKCNKI